MSWTEEPPADPGADPAPETDWFSTLDETGRQAVDARIQQETAAAAEAARAEVMRAQSQKDGRHGNTVRQLGDYGLAVDPQTGNVVAQNPQALLLAAGRYANTPPPVVVDEEPEPYEVEKYRAWTQQQAAKAAEAATTPLLQELRELRQLMQQTAFSSGPRPQDVARQTLAQYGQDGLADTPEFQTALSGALANATPAQLADPATIQYATVMAMHHTRQSGVQVPTTPAAPPTPTQPAVNPAVAAQQAARSGIGQVNVSAGHSAPPTTIPREQRLAQVLESFTGRKISKATYDQAMRQPLGPIHPGER